MTGYTEDSDLIPGDIRIYFQEYRFTEIIPLPEYGSDQSLYRFYKALRYGRWHLLKTLRPDLVSQPLYQQLLVKEFEIGYSLSHPHVVQTLGWEQLPDIGPAIVLEFIEGHSLRHLLETEQLSKKQAQQYIAQLCAALAYIHTKQITHRDLKPDNIILTRDGHHLKLIDFSLADGDSYAILKGPAGTRRYAAPEQLHPGETDTSVDIYALGKVIADMGHWRRVAKRCCRELPQRRPTAEQLLDYFQHPYRFQTRVLVGVAFVLLAVSWWVPLRHAFLAAPRDTLVRRDTIVVKDTTALVAIRQKELQDSIFEQIHVQLAERLRKQTQRAARMWDTVTQFSLEDTAWCHAPDIGNLYLRRKAKEWYETQLRREFPTLSPTSATYGQYQQILDQTIRTEMFDYEQNIMPRKIQAILRRR